jgi:hypothetical protein
VPKTCLASPINQGPEALHGRALSWIAKPNLEGPIPNNVEQNRIYRAFACWCARRAWEYAKCAPCVDVVLAAEAYLRGQWSFETMLALQKKRSSGVAYAGICGVQRSFPSAVAQIAAWHAADANPTEAADRVIRHMIMTAVSPWSTAP